MLRYQASSSQRRLILRMGKEWTQSSIKRLSNYPERSRHNTTTQSKRSWVNSAIESGITISSSLKSRTRIILARSWATTPSPSSPMFKPSTTFQIILIQQPRLGLYSSPSYCNSNNHRHTKKAQTPVCLFTRCCSRLVATWPSSSGLRVSSSAASRSTVLTTRWSKSCTQPRQRRKTVKISRNRSKLKRPRPIPFQTSCSTIRRWVRMRIWGNPSKTSREACKGAWIRQLSTGSSSPTSTVAVLNCATLAASAASAVERKWSAKTGCRKMRRRSST